MESIKKYRMLYAKNANVDALIKAIINKIIDSYYFIAINLAVTFLNFIHGNIYHFIFIHS